MKLYLVLACLLSIVYGGKPSVRSIDWDDEDEQALCEGGRIKPASIPFESKQEAEDWLAQSQMCYFAFVNEDPDAKYPDILADIVTDDTKVCFGGVGNDCEDPTDPAIVEDLNTLKDYVDLHSQEYVITEFNGDSFKAKGKRYVKVDPDLVKGSQMFNKIKGAVSGFGSHLGIPMMNTFEEEYTFYADVPNTGKLKSRVMTTENGLAKKLIKAGLIKYAHFAKSIGQSFDIPERFKYDGDNVYYIQVNNIAVFAALIIVAALTLIMFCYSLKIMKSCLCGKKKVHRYHKVMPKEVESTDME